jgi:hypothetical protein
MNRRLQEEVAQRQISLLFLVVARDHASNVVGGKLPSCVDFFPNVGEVDHLRPDFDAAPLAVSPPQLITFRTDNVPNKLVSSMKEAIASHGVQSYRAAALMVRRTLEILCQEKGAAGKDLKERLSNLSQFAILPPKLLEAADHLRLLGNDAAHVEAKVI